MPSASSASGEVSPTVAVGVSPWVAVLSPWVASLSSRTVASSPSAFIVTPFGSRFADASGVPILSSAITSRLSCPRNSSAMPGDTGTSEVTMQMVSHAASARRHIGTATAPPPLGTRLCPLLLAPGARPHPPSPLNPRRAMLPPILCNDHAAPRQRRPMKT